MCASRNYTSTYQDVQGSLVDRDVLFTRQLLLSHMRSLIELRPVDHERAYGVVTSHEFLGTFKGDYVPCVGRSIGAVVPAQLPNARFP